MARPWEVSADDIVAWARTAPAAATLPKLVRRLLFATAPLRSLVMPADTGIRLPGRDGIVEATRNTTFCPAGTSHWELSVDANVKTKRIGERAASAVAVTARRLPRKGKWIREKEQQGEFAAVAAFDADDFATWLRQSPPVARWFASTLGRPAVGAARFAEERSAALGC
jgi:muconolactone delta-isomerase